jgi:hypothetical protein
MFLRVIRWSRPFASVFCRVKILGRKGVICWISSWKEGKHYSKKIGWSDMLWRVLKVPGSNLGRFIGCWVFLWYSSVYPINFLHDAVVVTWALSATCFATHCSPVFLNFHSASLETVTSWRLQLICRGKYILTVKVKRNLSLCWPWM